MFNVFSKKIRFAVPVSELFSFFSDAEAQSRATGARAKGDAVPGTAFSAGAGAARGKTLYVEQDRLIVQSWRASDWEKGFEDSILTLRFFPTASGSELQITQSGLPEGVAFDVKNFWSARYWKPIKSFIKAEKKAATPPKPRGRPRKTVSAEVLPAKAAKTKREQAKTKISVAELQAAKRRGRPSKAAADSASAARAEKGKSGAEKTVAIMAPVKPAARVAKSSGRRGRPSTLSTGAGKDAAPKAKTAKAAADKTVTSAKRGRKKAE